MAEPAKERDSDDTTPTAAAPAPPAAAPKRTQQQQQQQYGKLGKVRVPLWLMKARAQLPVSLHREIELFQELMRPTAEEERMRADVVARLGALVRELWPAAEMALYGSCVTGTCLPMSDVDVVVAVDTPYPPLPVLGTALRDRFAGSAVDELPAARVPLIKLRDAVSRLTVDISFNSQNGPRNSSVVCRLLARHRDARPLIFVLKYLLYYHALNEVYTGGLGSYALTLMVVAHIQRQQQLQLQQAQAQQQQAQQQAQPAADLGALLVSFLRFYGLELDYERHGVALRGEDGAGSTLFAKRERGWLDDEKPYLLALEDPSDPENDVGRGAFRILAVRQLFRDAYEQLTAVPFCPVSYLSLLFDVTQQFHSFRRSVAAPFKVKNPPKKQQQKGAQHRQQQQQQQQQQQPRDTTGDPPTRDTASSSSSSSSRRPEDEAAAQHT